MKGTFLKEYFRGEQIIGLASPWHWHLIENWPQKQNRLFPWRSPVEMNSLTSQLSVLLDWICLPTCLCQSSTETNRENERNMGGETCKTLLCQMLTCNRKETEKWASGLNGVKLISPFSSPYCSQLFFSPVRQICHQKLKGRRTWTNKVFQSPKDSWEQLNEQN